MRKPKNLIALFICLTLGLIFVPQTSVNAVNNDDDDDGGTMRFCPQQFEATVHQGPDAEKLGVRGTISLERTGDKGQVDGRVLLEDGSAIPVHGQIFGRAANLMLDLGNDVHVTGTGTILRKKNPHENCVFLGGGGTFSGPQEADMGTWGVSNCAVTSFFCPDPPPPIDCTVDKIKNAILQPNGRITFAAGGSCVQPNTDKLTVINITTGETYGPFSLQYDITGTLFVGIYNGNQIQPVGTCRNFYVTNAAGLRSSTVKLCR